MAISVEALDALAATAVRLGGAYEAAPSTRRRRIVTREADNPKGDDLSRIRRNAKRLLRDAKLLRDNKRYASAFALAVLGLEEIGKVILKRWGLPGNEGRSWHLNKQLAVSSLLMVDAVIREGQKPRRGMIDPAEVGQPRSDAALKRIIKAAMESEAGRFSQSVDAKVLDKMKQSVSTMTAFLKGQASILITSPTRTLNPFSRCASPL
jgi:AbiV family abortive infection protein